MYGCWQGDRLSNLISELLASSVDFNVPVSIGGDIFFSFVADVQFPMTGRGFQEVQMNLNSKAANLNQATSDIVTAASQEDAHHRVAPASDRFGNAYEEFIDGGLEMAGVTKDHNTQTQIVTGLRSVSMVSSRFLMATKSLLVDPYAPNAKNQLTQAAR